MTDSDLLLVGLAGVGMLVLFGRPAMVTGAPEWASFSPPGAALGEGYGYRFTAAGAQAFAISGGALPPGLALESTTGVLSGTPTVAGTYSFTVTAQNSAGSATTPVLTLTVALATSGVLAIVPFPSEFQMHQGQVFGYQFTATGGVPPYQWLNASGTIVAGLTLRTDGLFAGTVLAFPPGNNFVIEVVDAVGASAQGAVWEHILS